MPTAKLSGILINFYEEELLCSLSCCILQFSGMKLQCQTMN